MKPLKTIACIIILTPGLITLQAKTKKPYKLPAIFNQAQYVYVEAVDGQQFDPNLYPEDRRAIADVQKALQDWNRYTLTVRREDAQLIFVVRKGRLAEGKVGVLVGTPPQNTPGRPSGAPGMGGGVGVGVGGEAGPPDDFLQVVLRDPNHSSGTTLWERTLANGLDPPDMSLFKELKDEVERTYPIQPASQKKP